MGLALPKGSRLTLTIQGKDFERPGATGPLRGVAWFTHDDPTDRPPELFAGTNTLHAGGQYQSYLLLPMLPMPIAPSSARPDPIDPTSFSSRPPISHPTFRSILLINSVLCASTPRTGFRSIQK